MTGHVVGGAGLEHVGAEIAVQRRIERVEPHDRRAALVHMLVPGPARRDDEIAFRHRAALAVDHGRGAVALDHEAQRVHGVAMRPRRLARHQDLQCGRQIRGGAGRVAVRLGIDQREHAPLDRRHRGHRHGGLDQRLELAPLPQMGARTAVAHLVGDRVLPQRPDVGSAPRLAHGLGRAVNGLHSAHVDASTADRADAAASLDTAPRTRSTTASGSRRGIIPAPRHMAVRPHQHELVAIVRRDCRIVDRERA